MIKLIGRWSKGADGRNWAVSLEEAQAEQRNFTMTQDRRGPVSILLPDPSAPITKAVVESRTEALQTQDESSFQGTEIGGLGSFLQGTGAFPLRVGCGNRPPQSNIYYFSIVVPNEDVVVLINVRLAFHKQL